jgi:simple sugar transport system permease protein
MVHQIAIRVGVIVLALIVCAIVTTLTCGLNPLDVYGTMIAGAVGSTRKVWILLQEAAMLLCVSLALTPAFRMKFWNLGGEGQILVGALASAACMILFGESMPNAALILVMFVASLAAGAIWAMIPAIFKAKWNTNETLFTLMMNYVATQLVAFFVIVWEKPKGSGQIGIINQSTNAGWLPRVLDNKYLLNVVLVLLVCVLLQVYLSHTKQGYEISVVGESQNTARYVGIKVDRVIIRTLLISGAICGFAGFLLVAGTNHTLTTTIAGGRGFTAVMVAWLAGFNPYIMIGSALLLEFLSCGASEISTIYGLNQSFGDILTGIILFFIIGTDFFINYRIVFSKKEVQDV